MSASPGDRGLTEIIRPCTVRYGTAQPRRAGVVAAALDVPGGARLSFVYWRFTELPGLPLILLLTD